MSDKRFVVQAYDVFNRGLKVRTELGVFDEEGIIEMAACRLTSRQICDALNEQCERITALETENAKMRTLLTDIAAGVEQGDPMDEAAKLLYGENYANDR
jgi:hypothetical protein